jgi:hypothetical protein
LDYNTAGLSPCSPLRVIHTIVYTHPLLKLHLSSVIQFCNQAQHAAKAVEADTAVEPEKFKLDRFKNVESVVFANVDFSRPEPAAPKPRSAPSIVAPPTEPYVSKRVSKLPSVPKKTEVNELPARRDVNFKAANARAVIQAPRRADEAMPADFRAKADYGKVGSLSFNQYTRSCISCVSAIHSL